MQGGRGRGNPFFSFGDPFGSFGGMPDLFGGRDPFDDPFFTRPFGGIFSSGPLGSPFMDLNPFGSSFFGPRANPFMVEQAPRIPETRPMLPNSSRGPIIEELNSDDEKEQPDADDGKNKNSREHVRSETQPYIVHPDDDFEAHVQSREPIQTQFGNELNMMNYTRSNPQSFTYQSSTVTYGGSNGAYYTSSMTKRAGSDGLRFEEYKEADSVTGQAAHRLLRGIHDKGHTVSRNLKSDGQVDTMQVLHNINEDELDGFEKVWNGKARKHLPGWTAGSSTREGLGEPRRALPSTEELRNHGSSSGSHVGVRRRSDGAEHGQSSKIRRV
ncbi:putative myeloid leukemia factor [Helianthus anomalus]